MEDMNGRDVFVRPIDPRNQLRVGMARTFLELIAEKSHLDRNVLNYPGVAILEAYHKGDPNAPPITVCPVHPVLMMESLGQNPNASVSERAAALAQMVKYLHTIAMINNQAEIYFPCTDEDVNAMAMAHGFHRQEYTLPSAQAQERDREDIPFFKMKVF